MTPIWTRPCHRVIAAIGVAIAVALAVAPAKAQDALGEGAVRGAGSTFAYPVLSQWSREYRAWLARGGDFPTAEAGLDNPTPSSVLEYEPVGSLAGTLRVKDRAVDFGVSDMPLKTEELAQLGLGQFPIVIGGVAVVVNLDGVTPGQIHLTGPVLADIFLGRITRWSDPAIASLNPTLPLPDAAILVVHRSDGSGTTFNFTHYLSRISPEWRQKVGAGLLVSWPTGEGTKGNEGVGETVRTRPHAIGYVDYARALELRLTYARLQNRARRFVTPETATLQAAASGVDWARTADFYALLTNAPSRNAYPIATAVFALMPRRATPARTRAALEFFRWSLEHGVDTATRLGYVPLPRPLVAQVTSYWQATFKTGT